jgi:hypothetical protein
VSKDRTVTVTFEGTDRSGQDFTFTRTVRADKSGDNPRFYAEQVAEAAADAAESIRKAVEGLYGETPA